jgi:hypothetical protein
MRLQRFGQQPPQPAGQPPLPAGPPPKRVHEMV